MNKNQLINTLRQQLMQAKKERLNIKNNPELQLAVFALKSFQSKRLMETHRDLLDNPGTKFAAQFFLNEIYGSKDLTQRDNDVEKLIPMMETAFPLNTLETITSAIVLDSLSETLDLQVANRLGKNFTEEEYDKAFREISTKEERYKQICIVESLGLSLCKLVRIPFLTTTLKMMRLPAKIAGLYSLHEFLESGFTVFKNTLNPEVFIKTLVARERLLLDKIYNSPKV